MKVFLRRSKLNCKTKLRKERRMKSGSARMKELIEAEELMKNLSEARVLDCSWYLSKRDCIGEYKREHIEGALFFDIDQIADKEKKLKVGGEAMTLPHMFPSKQLFDEEMSEFGISENDWLLIPNPLSNTFQIPFKYLSNTFQTPFKYLPNTFQTPFKYLSNTFQTPFKQNTCSRFLLLLLIKEFVN